MKNREIKEKYLKEREECLRGIICCLPSDTEVTAADLMLSVKDFVEDWVQYTRNGHSVRVDVLPKTVRIGRELVSLEVANFKVGDCETSCPGTVAFQIQREWDRLELEEGYIAARTRLVVQIQNHSKKGVDYSGNSSFKGGNTGSFTHGNLAQGVEFIPKEEHGDLVVGWVKIRDMVFLPNQLEAMATCIDHYFQSVEATSKGGESPKVVWKQIIGTSAYRIYLDEGAPVIDGSGPSLEKAKKNFRVAALGEISLCLNRAANEVKKVAGVASLTRGNASLHDKDTYNLEWQLGRVNMFWEAIKGLDKITEDTTAGNYTVGEE